MNQAKKQKQKTQKCVFVVATDTVGSQVMAAKLS